jgi:hypothetical protein
LDSRTYKDITPTIFGYITAMIECLCALGQNALPALKTKMEEILPSLERPLFAFNTHFEQGVLYHYSSTRLISTENNQGKI